MINHNKVDNNSKQKLASFVFIMLVLIVQLIQITKILQLYDLESLLFHVTFVFLFFGILTLFRRDEGFSKIQNIAFFIVVLSFLAVFYTSKSISFNYFKKLFIFLSTVMCLLFTYKTSFVKSVKKVIYISSITQSIVFCFFYNLGYGYQDDYNEYLTFGFSNPNFTGMWILNITIIAFICFYDLVYSRKKFLSIFVLFLILNNIYYILLTQNRSSILGIVFFVVGLIVTILTKKRLFLPNTLVVTSIPIIVIVVYYILVKNGSINIFSFIESEGKSLLSRDTIWQEGITATLAHPILGSYYDVLNNLSYSQMHNIYLDVSASYGIPVTALLFYYIFKILKSIRKQIEKKHQAISFLGFATILIVNSFEASLVSGSTGLYILTCSLIVLAKNECV